MTNDEIVRALRCYASDCDGDDTCFQCTFAWMCDKCDGNAPEIIADAIESLQAQLAESQRREQAAVEDLNGTGACFTCKHFRRNGGDCFGAGRCRLDGIEIWPCNEPGVYRVEVPDDGRQTYDWRGPQEAWKGRGNE